MTAEWPSAVRRQSAGRQSSSHTLGAGRHARHVDSHTAKQLARDHISSTAAPRILSIPCAISPSTTSKRPLALGFTAGHQNRQTSDTVDWAHGGAASAECWRSGIGSIRDVRVVLLRWERCGLAAMHGAHKNQLAMNESDHIILSRECASLLRFSAMGLIRSVMHSHPLAVAHLADRERKWVGEVRTRGRSERATKRLERTPASVQRFTA